jgi:hypothetical protein
MDGNDERALGRRDTSEEAANLNLASAQQLGPTTYNQLGTWQKKPLNNQTNE